MGFFTKLEKLSEKYIEGFFKTRFADHVQPAEIAKLLLREMRDNKSVSVSKIYVPNEYTVYMGKQDWETVEPVSGTLSSELQQFLQLKAADKGYELVGETKVSFQLDEKLSLGEIVVKSSFSEEVRVYPDPHAGLPEKTGPVSENTIIAERKRLYEGTGNQDVLNTLTRIKAEDMRPKAMLAQKIGEADGFTFPLGTQGILIGRRRTNDIAVEDCNVSRVHASIDYLAGDYFVTDLGSTNGTYVNGTKVSRKKLVPGDLIRVGSTTLEFRVV